jgi:YspA, cpYpsA-related SLOG family/Meiotically up-regulated gene 113
MIYFVQNTVTRAIKIGYSKNAKKRLDSLQTATPDKLALLGTIQGGLEHEAALHERFAGYALQGEWFKGDILREVLGIIAQHASGPQPQETNVIVAGDSDFFFVWSSNEQQMANRGRLEALVFQALSEIHSKTPIAWVITGGERLLEHFAWQWANKNKVQIQRYYPKWRRYGKGGASKVGQQMLRSMFDPKVLLVFLTGKGSSSTQTLLRRADKAGIEVKRVTPNTVTPLDTPGIAQH